MALLPSRLHANLEAPDVLRRRRHSAQPQAVEQSLPVPPSMSPLREGFSRRNSRDATNRTAFPVTCPDPVTICGRIRQQDDEKRQDYEKRQDGHLVSEV